MNMFPAESPHFKPVLPYTQRLKSLRSSRATRASLAAIVSGSKRLNSIIENGWRILSKLPSYRKDGVG